MRSEICWGAHESVDGGGTHELVGDAGPYTALARYVRCTTQSQASTCRASCHRSQGRARGAFSSPQVALYSRGAALERPEAQGRCGPDRVGGQMALLHRGEDESRTW